MSLTSLLSKLFGNKSQRDLKEIKPIIDKITALGPKMQALSNDELRQVITDVRSALAEATAAADEAIKSLKIKVEELPFEERQPLWDKIDAHEKNILDTLEDKLNQYLPTVFAAVRETAARFAHNDVVEVAATDLDRELAAQGKDFVSIEGDKALWKNHGLAGGNDL